MRRRVVVTGLGLVTPLGNSVEETWAGLVAGRSGAARIARFDPSALDVTFACEVKGFDGQACVGKKEARRYDLFLQYAVAASQQAVEAAGFAGGFPHKDRAGVIIGSGIGGMQTFEDQARIFIEEGPSRVSPFFVPMFIPDIAAGVVSIRYGLTGPNYCTVSACASSAHAVGQAYRLIRDGDADVMIAGGAEAPITPLGVAGFCAMKATTERNDEPEKASRPFDARRDGFLMGEGAGIVILEELGHALRRGAAVYAEVVGYGMSGDAFHAAAPAEDGDGAIRCMRLALNDAGVPPDVVRYINAHGTSTPLNDKIETAAVKTVFGPHAYKLSLNSTKSMTGHLLGASGGIETGITALCLKHQIMTPTINYEFPDPECDLDYVPNTARPAEIIYAMSNSFGFGGTNGTLLLRRFEE